jgi:hypothetical protein
MSEIQPHSNNFFLNSRLRNVYITISNVLYTHVFMCKQSPWGKLVATWSPGLMNKPPLNQSGPYALPAIIVSNIVSMDDLNTGICRS